MRIAIVASALACVLACSGKKDSKPTGPPGPETAEPIGKVIKTDGSVFGKRASAKVARKFMAEQDVYADDAITTEGEAVVEIRFFHNETLVIVTGASNRRVDELPAYKAIKAGKDTTFRSSFKDKQMAPGTHFRPPPDGKPDENVARSELARKLDKIVDRCYADLLKIEPDAKGSMTVSGRLTRAGKLTAIRLAYDDNALKNIRACVTQRGGSLNLSGAAADVEVQYKYTLPKPSAPPPPAP
jgi:hypothetical protein